MRARILAFALCAFASLLVPAVAFGQASMTVFVTSTTHDGNLGGLAGADAICQARATAASLSGTYRAWLSSSTASPSTRFTQSTVPYQLVNGTTIANDWADLTDGALAAPIFVTETGAAPSAAPFPFAWTHTLTNGTAGGAGGAGATCSDWTASGPGPVGNIGLTDLANALWTDAGAFPCPQLFHLYCFQQPGPPGAPTIGTAIAGNAQATVSFTPPASNGGSAITGYTVTSNPGGITASGTASPITVTGLTNGTAYTFTVTATNAIGTGPASAASNSVTPAAPFNAAEPIPTLSEWMLVLLALAILGLGLRHRARRRG